MSYQATKISSLCIRLSIQISALLICMLVLTTGCRAPMQQTGINPSNPLLAEIPFRLDHGHIVIPVRLNNSQPLDFVVDTGAGVPLVNQKLIEPLHLHQTWLISKRVECWNGWGTVHFLDDITLDVGGMEYSPFLVATMPMHSIDGLLGYDLFKRFVVEMDFKANRLRLFNPKLYQYNGSGVAFSIKLRHRIPYIEASVCGPDLRPHRGSFLVDTGNPGILTLDESAALSLGIIEPTNRFLQATKGDLVSEFAVRYGQITQLRLGPYSMSQPWSDFLIQSMVGARNDGVIGLGAMKQFKVVFDYSRRQMILEPNANYGKSLPLQWRGNLIQISSAEGFRLWLSGAQLSAIPPEFNAFRVSQVKPNSPAEQSGFRMGDFVTAIDGQSLSTFSLEQFMGLLGRNGQMCSVELARGHDMISTKLKLDWLCFWEQSK